MFYEFSIKKSISKLTKKIPNTQGKVLNTFNTFGKGWLVRNNKTRALSLAMANIERVG